MNDTYTTKLDKRQLSLLRLAQSIIRETANPALEDAYRAARLAILDNNEPRTKKQLDVLIKEMTSAYKKSIEESFRDITSQMYELGLVEAAFTAKVMNEFSEESFKTPADKVVKRYIENSVMQFHGKHDTAFSWDEYLKTHYQTSADNIRSAVNAVWLEQVTTGKLPALNDYVKRVKIANDGVNKRDAENIIRTGVNQFSSKGREAFRDDNLDVITREYPIAVFDNRTSKICISISAKYGIKGWPPGKSPVGYPPFHNSCRTGIGFYTLGQTEPEGERQAVEGRKGEEAKDAFEARKERLRTKSKVTYKGRKDEAFIAKEVSAATPIAQFLRNQPAWFIASTLGKTAGLAFRQGKLDLTQLTDKNLKPLTLKELDLE